MAAMDSSEQPVKRRRRCPVCGSAELTRLNRAWQERLVGWFVGAHKYRCFICGHQFMGQFRLERGREKEPD